jgi:iron complex outermembrane receptor protein
LSSYEISFKNKTDRFFTSLSYFYYDRIDQQLSISAQQNASDPNSFYYFTTNSEGKGFSRGVEIDFNAKISNRLSLKTALAYLDTWTNKFSYTTSNNNVQSGGGRETAMAPKISSSATLTYKHNLLFITLSQNYKDEYYYSDSHNQKSAPYSLLNLTLGKSFGKTTATIWIRNAMDKRYTTRGFYFGLIPPTYPDQLWKSYGDPRQIGVTIDYTF